MRRASARWKRRRWRRQSRNCGVLFIPLSFRVIFDRLITKCTQKRGGGHRVGSSSVFFHQPKWRHTRQVDVAQTLSDLGGCVLPSFLGDKAGKGGAARVIGPAARQHSEKVKKSSSRWRVEKKHEDHSKPFLGLAENTPHAHTRAHTHTHTQAACLSRSQAHCGHMMMALDR